VNNRAYTLIELIVVLVLVSSLLLIALPSLKDTLSAYPARAEARKLAEIIEETRSRATREQTDFTLHVDIEKGLFWTCRRSEPAEGQERSGNSSWTLPEGVRIAGIQCGSGEMQKTGEAQILFSGQSYARPAVIQLLRDNLSVTLTIRPFMNAVEIQGEPIEDQEESDRSE
jgi:general secretion pathway protein H